MTDELKANVELRIMIDEDHIASLAVNDEEKGLDLSSKEVQAQLGKTIAELVLEKRKLWREWKKRVSDACDCFARDKEPPLNSYHSSGCASWEVK